MKVGSRRPRGRTLAFAFFGTLAPVVGRRLVCAIHTLILAVVSATATTVVLAQDESARLIVEDVQCRGNTATACSFIRSHLHVSPGQALDEMEVQNAKLRLTALHSFESADIYLEKGSEKGRVVVVIEVQEVDPITTEWSFGTSARLSSIAQTAGGRVSHQNLFGTGKYADFTVAGATRLDDSPGRGFTASLRYADPQLFGSRKYFASASASYFDSSFDGLYGNYAEIERLRLGIEVGRRIWDFSYLTIGYAYQAKLDGFSHTLQRDGTFEDERARNRHALDFLYGWNSENDFYFPTHGSSFHVGLGWDFRGVGSDRADAESDQELHLQFRKTWQTDGGSLWTVKIGGEPTTEHRSSFNESQLFSLTYARPIAADDELGIERGRWYIEPGWGLAGFRPDGTNIQEIGLKIGVRLETQTFGIVDLYLIGSGQYGSGGRDR